MKLLNYILAATFVVTSFMLNRPVKADSQTMLISEIQTGSTASANEEFIELYNASIIPIDLSTWKIEYYPSSATAYGSPFRTITLNGVVNAGEFFLLASTDYLTDSADLSFSKVLAASGGAVRLVKSDTPLGTQAIDSVGWGSATLAEGTKATAAGDGKSLARKPLVKGLQDTNNNSADFEILATPTPTSGLVVPSPDPVVDPVPSFPPETTPPPQESPQPDPVVPTPDPTPAPTPDPAPLPQIATLPIQITELLPNPASPATDDSDEFVELYNPNDIEVSLNGFVLKTGNSLSYQQKLDGLSIGPKAYLSLFSRDTDLVLSNTSGKAVLFGPDGAQMSATDPYESAPEGQSWVYTNNSWQWTTSPSPGAENILVIPIIKTSSSTSPIKKTTTAKKAATTKPAATKAVAKTAAAKKATSTTKPKKAVAVAGDQASAVVHGRPLHPVVLGTAAILAILYGLYEYRADIRNQIRKLKRYRSAGE